MSELQAAQIETALRVAVESAIKTLGLATLKSTSLFMSNERRVMKQAA